MHLLIADCYILIYAYYCVQCPPESIVRVHRASIVYRVSAWVARPSYWGSCQTWVQQVIRRSFLPRVCSIGSNLFVLIAIWSLQLAEMETVLLLFTCVTVGSRGSKLLFHHLNTSIDTAFSTCVRSTLFVINYSMRHSSRRMHFFVNNSELLLLYCRAELYVKSAHGTLVIFLQNDAGHAKWAPTADRLKELLLAYHPVSEPKPL